MHNVSLGCKGYGVGCKGIVCYGVMIRVSGVRVWV